LYSQANRYGTQPGVLVDAILTRVTFPVFSKYQTKKYFLKKYYKRLQINLAIIIIPLMLSLILISDSLIPLVLGEQWVSIIPYFNIFCVISMTYPFHPLSLSILKVYGLSSLIFKLEIFKKIVMTIILILTISEGVQAIIIGQLIYFLIILPVNMHYGGKELKYNLITQFKNIVSYLIAATTCYFVSVYISGYFGLDNKMLLILSKMSLFYSLFVGFIYLKEPKLLISLLKFFKK
jgi:teichuronic acid exporter